MEKLISYENELKNIRSLTMRLAGEIDYKNHLLMEKDENISNLLESLMNEKKLLIEKSASISLLLSENSEKDKLLDEKSETITKLTAEKERLIYEISTVKNDLNQKENNLDEISGAISLLIAQKNEKDILIDVLNTLKVEKEKLVGEKDAEIRTLTIQNVEKEKLIDSISANARDLMTKKNRFHEAYVKESSKIEKMKQEIEKLQLDLESKDRTLEQNERMQEIATIKRIRIEPNLQHDEDQNYALVTTEQTEIQDLKEWRDKVNELRKEVEEKAEALQNLEMDNRTLMIKELRSNHELQAARRAAIEGFQGMHRNRVNIGIKRVGEVDQKPFREACSEKFDSGNWDEEFGFWEERSMELCSLWQDKISDPGWQPFKHEDIDGKLTEVIDENDRALKELREEWGEEVYEAVTEALLGVNEYNASGRYPVSELWNFKEKRRATLGEVMQYVIKQWKVLKKK